MPDYFTCQGKSAATQWTNYQKTIKVKLKYCIEIHLFKGFLRYEWTFQIFVYIMLLLRTVTSNNAIQIRINSFVMNILINFSTNKFFRNEYIN